MDAATLEAILKMHLRKMRERLDRAAGIAKAAEACAEAGNVTKAVEIALDVEQLLYGDHLPERRQHDAPDPHRLRPTSR
jgi:hypothetical protein